MRLPLLWLSLVLLPYSDGEIECVRCDGRVISDDRTCTNCTGDYCFSIDYKNHNAYFRNETSFYQGCFTTPTPLTTGCFKNPQENVFCICNGSDYCNSMDDTTVVTTISYKNCGRWTGFGERNCSGPVCVWDISYDGRDKFLQCLEGHVEMNMYTLGFITNHMFLPINSCYSIVYDAESDQKQICAFEDANRKYGWKTKIPGNVTCFVPDRQGNRLKNTTCVGQYCYSVEEDFGCISQYDQKGHSLKAGLYHLTPFIAPFYICDSEFCNNETIFEEGRYSYPTTFQWSDSYKTAVSWLWLSACWGALLAARE